jgi:hypothetical protein
MKDSHETLQEAILFYGFTFHIVYYTNMAEVRTCDVEVTLMPLDGTYFFIWYSYFPQNADQQHGGHAK